MIRKLYNYTYDLAQHPHAFWALAFVAFVESSVFPIPPDVLLIPLVLANRHKAFFLAGVATVSSVIGGLLGYGIGHFLFETIGRPVLESYGYHDAIASFSQMYNEWGIWIVAAAGFTPIPYKLITIASGATGLNLYLFIITSIISRAARFYLVALLIKIYGEKIHQFIDKYINWLSLAFFILLFGGFLVIKKIIPV